MARPSKDKATERELFPHTAEVAQSVRERAMRQRSVVVWTTGLSGAGKSTIAYRLESTLFARGQCAFVLDGDTLRTGLNRDLSFSLADRHENVRRTAHVARVLADAGLIVISALISPTREDRAIARQIVGDRFLEVHVDADIAVCERRDPKGLYSRARAGEIPAFTGVSSPYQPPLSPDLRLDTSAATVDQCALMIYEELERRGIFDAVRIHS